MYAIVIWIYTFDGYLPASIAFLAASLNSLTISGISAVLSAVGSVALCVNGLLVDDIKVCPSGLRSA